jgi:rhamnose transport system permease protein
MPSTTLQTRESWFQRWFPNNEWVLVFILAFEIVAFSLTGDNFATSGNVFEITRLAVSYGLLAFSMTFVIKTGGIDLSVGSIMALVAVVTGVCWQTLGMNIWLASLLGILAGGACGAFNGLVVTRLGIPPLIVTLGTMSLFRGAADSITEGYTTYTGFDPAFLRLGQGYLWGVVPTQLPVFLLVLVVLWTLMHRMRFGRQVTAIGFGEPGARYAGIPTRSVLLRVYMLSGLMAGLAAIIFIAKNGQAKSDAGMGYEMMAIAMAVLGGTAITGGRGTIHGSLLGLFAIVVLQNGLRLSGQTTDIANMLTGVILIGAILVDRISRTQRSTNKQVETGKDLDMKNNQLILLCASIILAACVVALSNRQLANAIRGATIVPGAAPTCSGDTMDEGAPEEPLRIALLPKAKTDPYFVSCKDGAEAAAKELGVELLWDGPTKGDPEKQNEIVEPWITKGVDVICASVLNRDAIDGVLKKAMDRGISVLTWDADANPDARQFFVNQATSQGIGYTLADQMASLCGDEGPYIIISAGTTDANQNEWIVHIKARMADAHPNMKLLEIRYSEGERDKALTEARNMLNKYPDLKGMMAIAAPAVPGAAEALKQANRTDVKLTGLSVPSLCKDYVHQGFIDTIVLWNTVDLGYLTVQAAKAVREGEIADGPATLDFGRLQGIEVGDGNIYLGQPFVFDKDNIDSFDF